MANTTDTKPEEEESSKRNDELWEREKDIKFSLATSNDVKEMQEFLDKEFLPEEPIFSNMKLITDGSGGRMHRVITDDLHQHMVKDGVENLTHGPSCIVARSTTSNKIVGVRTGIILSRKDNIKKEEVGCWSCFLRLPKWLRVPHILVNMINLGLLLEEIRYGHHMAFEELEDAQMIYFCSVLAVGASERGKGLGTELIKRGYSLAKKAGCDYTYSAASSTFTQKIFKNLGNSKVIHEARYEDYRKDAKGRPFLVDTGVHESVQTTIIDHREKDEKSSE